MFAKEKLKIFKDKENKYHFKTKDDRHVDIEHNDKRLKFKLHKWDREASVEAVLDMVEADTHKFSGNKIEVEDSKKKIRVYPIDVYGGDGGLRFELVYKEKPPTYSFTVPIVSKNMRWGKQPFLTQEDRNKGLLCPENVEGSYAVYHISKKNNQYMTGKAFHLYRPIAIDAEGNKAWCELDIDRSIDPTSLTVTPPQQFMNEAIYPVTVDPDFGYTTIGSVPGGMEIAVFPDGEIRLGNAWTMPAPGGTANYIRAYLAGNGFATDCKVFINEKDSGGAGTHGQIATKENLACAAAPHWEEFTLSGEVLTAGVNYILNIIGDGTDPGAGDKYIVYCDQDTTAVAYYGEVSTYGVPESPWVINPTGPPTYDLSLYCNYSPPAVEEGGLRMILSLKGHMGYDLKTREGKARRRMW